MKISEMKYRIDIQKLINYVNENGYEIASYEDYKTVWAKVSKSTSKENNQTVNYQNEEQIIFVVRNISGLDDNMRILFQSDIYKITFIDYFKLGSNYIEIKAIKEVV